MAVSARNFNGKKEVQAFCAYGVAESDLGTVLGYLPDNSLVLYDVVEIVTASGTANATLDLTVGGTVMHNEVAAASVATISGTIAKNFSTGGEIKVVAGAVAPANGATVFNITIMYVEYTKSCGELTRDR